MTIHTERPGHCAACAAEIAELTERLQQLEQLHASLDEAVARHIRDTEAVPAALPEAVTVPGRKVSRGA